MGTQANKSFLPTNYNVWLVDMLQIGAVSFTLGI